MPGSSFDILCIPSCSFLSISHLILLLSDPDADSSSQVRSLPPSLPSAQTVPASPKRLPASYIQLFSQLSISALPALFNSFSDTNSADLSTEPSSLDTVFPNPLPPDVAKSAIFFPAKS